MSYQLQHKDENGNWSAASNSSEDEMAVRMTQAIVESAHPEAEYRTIDRDARPEA